MPLLPPHRFFSACNNLENFLLRTFKICMWVTLETLKCQNIGHQNKNAFIYNFILVYFQGFGQERIACYSVLRHDAVSLGMLYLVVVFTGCQIQSFCSPITVIAFHCQSDLIFLTQ